MLKKKLKNFVLLALMPFTLERGLYAGSFFSSTLGEGLGAGLKRASVPFAIEFSRACFAEGALYYGRHTVDRLSLIDG